MITDLRIPDGGAQYVARFAPGERIEMLAAVTWLIGAHLELTLRLEDNLWRLDTAVRSRAHLPKVGTWCKVESPFTRESDNG